MERGVGYGILPYASVIKQVRAGTHVVMPIVEPRMSRQLVLATSTQLPTTIATRSLAQTVKELVRDLVAEGMWIPRIGADGVAKLPAASREAKLSDAVHGASLGNLSGKESVH